jgi:RNA polymerase sigma-70 factor (ECF subfamily)
MDRNAGLAAIFERDRPRLRRIAQRFLGDWDQAEEAVQESWLKTDKIPHDEIRNASAWLTTITTRVCLDRLRYRRRRARMHAIELDDPANESEVAKLIGDEGPEHGALMADSIGVALLVILERLGPLERVAFVLHDVFAVPFDEVASLIDRSPEAARQLASRARRRLRGTVEFDEKTISRHRELAEAFLKAAKSGDMAALLNLLDPRVVLTADEQAASVGYGRTLGPGRTLAGSDQVARFLAGRAAAAHVAIINGDVGIIVAPNDRLMLAIVPRFTNSRITHLHAVAAPDDLARLDLGLVAGGNGAGNRIQSATTSRK